MKKLYSILNPILILCFFILVGLKFFSPSLLTDDIFLVLLLTLLIFSQVLLSLTVSKEEVTKDQPLILNRRIGLGWGFNPRNLWGRRLLWLCSLILLVLVILILAI